jgi:hypothetical protein
MAEAERKNAEESLKERNPIKTPEHQINSRGIHLTLVNGYFRYWLFGYSSVCASTSSYKPVLLG